MMNSNGLLHFYILQGWVFLLQRWPRPGAEGEQCIFSQLLLPRPLGYWGTPSVSWSFSPHIFLFMTLHQREQLKFLPYHCRDHCFLKPQHLVSWPSVNRHFATRPRIFCFNWPHQHSSRRYIWSSHIFATIIFLVIGHATFGKMTVSQSLHILVQHLIVAAIFSFCYGFGIVPAFPWSAPIIIFLTIFSTRQPDDLKKSKSDKPWKFLMLLKPPIKM